MPQPSAVPPSPVTSAPETTSLVRAPSRPALEFKGLSHPALRLVVHEGGSDAISAALAALGDDDGFEWQPVVIDASRLAGQTAPDWPALLAALRSLRLHPVAIAGADESMREQAERLQLGWLAPLPERRRAAEVAAARAEAQASPTAAEPGPAPADDAGRAAPADAPEPAAAPIAAPAGAMIVERPVRSGQQIYARDRDLVVVGDVSPGAEVIADGDVHIYGTLGGRAIAGARGRRDATIFTLDLQAELVAVCGIYRTFEEGPPADRAGKPVRISLEANADTLSMRTL
jgi:septum site-determining protein MinC